MIRFRSFNTLAEAEFVAGLLTSKGIPSEARDRVPKHPGGAPSVWISREEDFEEATRIVDAPPKHRGRPWTCPKCRNENEAQFDACWSCTTARE